MSTHYTYLVVDTLCLFFPLVFTFHPKIKFYRTIGPFLISSLLTAFFFVAWDMLFTKLGVWHFNPDYVSGIYLYNLPLEEILFFFCIPYACVFTYFCITRFLPLDTLERASHILSVAMCCLLLVFTVFNCSRIVYFQYLFLPGGIYDFLFDEEVSFPASFYVSFLIILLPFFISNGILTQSVVMYSYEYNLGVRLFTIPVEDVFYGMLLMLMNVYGFEYFGAKIKA